jgi:exocyst complex component 3
MEHWTVNNYLVVSSYKVKVFFIFQCLDDLENSRDDLLYELHRLPNQSSHDKIMLKAYFEDVEMVSNLLEKQIKLILARTLNTVRKEPTVIVTALRIIEREEKRDQMALQVNHINVII